MAKKGKSPTEDRDQQILRRLANIEGDIRSIRLTDAFAIRANSDMYIDEIKKIFKGTRRAQVYLATDGERTSSEISELLGIFPPHNVSREFRILRDEGLVRIIQKVGNNTIWGKTHIESILRVSKILMKEHGLDKDGLMD